MDEVRQDVGAPITISRELYLFLMGEGPLEGVWFGDLNDGRLGRFWWRALLRCAAGWPEPPHPTLPEQLPEAGITIGEEG